MIAEEEYLKVIEKLKELFGKENKIKNTEIIKKVNQLLVKARYAYKKQEHWPKHPSNIFFTGLGGANNIKNYDLAFYNNLADKYRSSHHRA